MAECADQAPGVVLMSEELGERKSEDEEDGEEEDGDDVAAEAGRLPTTEANHAVGLCSEKQNKKRGELLRRFRGLNTVWEIGFSDFYLFFNFRTTYHKLQTSETSVRNTKRPKHQKKSPKQL